MCFCKCILQFLFLFLVYVIRERKMQYIYQWWRGMEYIFLLGIINLYLLFWYCYSRINRVLCTISRFFVSKNAKLTKSHPCIENHSLFVNEKNATQDFLIINVFVLQKNFLSRYCYRKKHISFLYAEGKIMNICSMVDIETEQEYTKPVKVSYLWEHSFRR